MLLFSPNTFVFSTSFEENENDNKIANYAICLWNMVFKGGMHLKGIWKYDPEASIFAQEEWNCGVQNTPQWGIL